MNVGAGPTSAMGAHIMRSLLGCTLIVTLSTLLAPPLAGCAADTAGDDASADSASSEPLLVDRIPGNPSICPASDRLHLGTAAWMAWFSANSYAHLKAFAPALEKQGFGKVGDGKFWITEFDRLKGAREKSTPSAAEVERALIQTVHPTHDIEFFSGGRVVSDRGKAVFQKGSTQVTWAVHRTEPYAVVAFRGTEGDETNDIAADLNIARAQSPIGGRVHEGFARALGEVDALLTDRLNALPAGTRLFVTGHSLGGALANVFLARAFVLRPDLRYALYTFGSPRVGQSDFAVQLESTAADLKVPLLRFHNGADPVATKPLEIFGWDHAGTAIHLDDRLALVDGAFDVPLIGHPADHKILNYFERVAKRASAQKPPYTVFGENLYRGETATTLAACPR
jgi:hypothetical protein